MTTVPVEDGGRGAGLALGSRRLRPIVLAVLGLAAAIVGARSAGQWWTIGRFTERVDDAYVGGTSR
jgi:multidrug resistance efflux pump